MSVQSYPKHYTQRKPFTHEEDAKLTLLWAQFRVNTKLISLYFPDRTSRQLKEEFNSNQCCKLEDWIYISINVFF